MTTMEEDVDDRYAGIDLDSLINRHNLVRPLSYTRKKSLYEAPDFIQRLSGEETVMEGQSLCIECKVTGFPAPTLRWFKDDEQLIDHPRMHVESDGNGGYCLILEQVNKGDEAAYRCRAENVEGASSCLFFLSVKCKPKSSKSKKKESPNKRSVSFPPMFATIVEKVEEEEKQGKETDLLPPSPMTDFYYALTLKGRQTWPAFVGDWAFTNGPHSQKRRGSTGSGSYYDSTDEEDFSHDENREDNDDEDSEFRGPPAKKPSFYIDVDGDFSSDDASSPTDDLIIYNSNIDNNDNLSTRFKHGQSGASQFDNNKSNGNNNEENDNSTSFTVNLDNVKSDNVTDSENNVSLPRLSSNTCSTEKTSKDERSNVEFLTMGDNDPNANEQRAATTVSESSLDAAVLEQVMNQLKKEDRSKTTGKAKVFTFKSETKGDVTPPIIVELWDEEGAEKSNEHSPSSLSNLSASGYSREEREPTPFFKGTDSKNNQKLGLHGQKQDTVASGPNRIDREPTPFFDKKHSSQSNGSGSSLGLPTEFEGVRQPRESTPFCKDETPQNHAQSSGNASLTVPLSSGMREPRESTPFYNEKDPYEYIHHPDHHFSEKKAVIIKQSSKEDEEMDEESAGGGVSSSQKKSDTSQNKSTNKDTKMDKTITRPSSVKTSKDADMKQEPGNDGKYEQGLSKDNIQDTSKPTSNKTVNKPLNRPTSIKLAQKAPHKTPNLPTEDEATLQSSTSKAKVNAVPKSSTLQIGAGTKPTSLAIPTHNNTATTVSTSQTTNTFKSKTSTLPTDSKPELENSNLQSGSKTPQQSESLQTGTKTTPKPFSSMSNTQPQSSAVSTGSKTGHVPVSQAAPKESQANTKSPSLQPTTATTTTTSVVKNPQPDGKTISKLPTLQSGKISEPTTEQTASKDIQPIKTVQTSNSTAANASGTQQSKSVTRVKPKEQTTLKKQNPEGSKELSSPKRSTVQSQSTTDNQSQKSRSLLIKQANIRDDNATRTKSKSPSEQKKTSNEPEQQSALNVFKTTLTKVAAQPTPPKQPQTTVKLEGKPSEVGFKTKSQNNKPKEQTSISEIPTSQSKPNVSTVTLRNQNTTSKPPKSPAMHEEIQSTKMEASKNSAQNQNQVSAGLPPISSKTSTKTESPIESKDVQASKIAAPEYQGRESRKPTRTARIRGSARQASPASKQPESKQSATPPETTVYHEHRTGSLERASTPTRSGAKPKFFFSGAKSTTKNSKPKSSSSEKAATSTSRSLTEEKEAKATGFSNVLASIFRPKHNNDKNIEDKPNEGKGKKAASGKEKGKKKQKRSRSQPLPPNSAQATGSLSQQSLVRCSPFGPYYVEGFCFLFLMTVACLNVDMPIEKFVCYVLASFYTFCIMRHLGLLE